MGGHVGEEGVGQVVEAAGEAVAQRAGRHGQVLQVARDRDAGQVTRLAVDADHDHGVGPQPPAVRPGIAAEERDVPPTGGERRRRRDGRGRGGRGRDGRGGRGGDGHRRCGGRFDRGRDAEVGQRARLGDLHVSRAGEHGVEQRVLAHGDQRKDGAGEQCGHADRHHEEGARDARRRGVRREPATRRARRQRPPCSRTAPRPVRRRTTRGGCRNPPTSRRAWPGRVAPPTPGRRRRPRSGGRTGPPRASGVRSPARCPARGPTRRRSREPGARTDASAAAGARRSEPSAHP